MEVNGIISRWKEVTSRVQPSFLITHSNDLDGSIERIISKILVTGKHSGNKYQCNPIAISLIVNLRTTEVAKEGVSTYHKAGLRRTMSQKLNDLPL